MTISLRGILRLSSAVTLPWLLICAGAAQPDPAGGGLRVLTLEQCLELGLRQNQRRPASLYAVAAAEAQHRQALAGYWPQVGVRGGYQRLDDPLNFLFPGGALQIPAQSVTVPGGTANLAFPVGGGTLNLPVTYPDQTITTPPQAFQFPDQDVKVMDRNLVLGNVDVKWLLWDGGMRRGYRQQGAGLVEMMRSEARRTDLEVSDSVRRYYWAGVLARQLHQVGKDTLARMEVTLKLTESLYQEGVGKVTKSDYLDNRVVVETLRAMVAQLERNERITQVVLAHACGLASDATVQPAAAEIAFEPVGAGLEEAVATSFGFNPDWGKLEGAISAAEGAATTAHSGYFPKVALTGELHRWWNGGYNGGFSTVQNRTGWTAGIGLEFPLFDGMLTRNRVAEARARVEQLKKMQLVLKDGLGVQIRDIWFGLDAAAKSREATLLAMQSAEANRDLNERAYQAELVETEKVIRAQLMEAVMSAQYYKTLYDHAELRSRLNVVVGNEVRKVAQAVPPALGSLKPDPPLGGEPK